MGTFPRKHELTSSVLDCNPYGALHLRSDNAIAFVSSAGGVALPLLRPRLQFSFDAVGSEKEG